MTEDNRQSPAGIRFAPEKPSRFPQTDPRSYISALPPRLHVYYCLYFDGSGNPVIFGEWSFEPVGVFNSRVLLRAVLPSNNMPICGDVQW